MKALVLTHADHEGPGALAAALAEAGVTLELRCAYRGEPVPARSDEWDLLVAMGGAMDAWDDAGHPWLADEARLLADRARQGRPTLGICLGAQLLARGLGARVYRGPALELGLAPITLNEAGRTDGALCAIDGRPVFHWHQDTFDLPAGATLLASSAHYAHQAYRAGARAYGLQFHLECDRAMRAAWAAAAADELRAAAVEPAALHAPHTAAFDPPCAAALGDLVGRLLG